MEDHFALKLTIDEGKRQLPQHLRHERLVYSLKNSIDPAVPAKELHPYSDAAKRFLYFDASYDVPVPSYMRTKTSSVRSNKRRWQQATDACVDAQKKGGTIMSYRDTKPADLPRFMDPTFSQSKRLSQRHCGKDADMPKADPSENRHTVEMLPVPPTFAVPGAPQVLHSCDVCKEDGAHEPRRRYPQCSRRLRLRKGAGEGVARPPPVRSLRTSTFDGMVDEVSVARQHLDELERGIQWRHRPHPRQEQPATDSTGDKDLPKLRETKDMQTLGAFDGLFGLPHTRYGALGVAAGADGLFSAVVREEFEDAIPFGLPIPRQWADAEQKGRQTMMKTIVVDGGKGRLRETHRGKHANDGRRRRRTGRVL